MSQGPLHRLHPRCRRHLCQPSRIQPLASSLGQFVSNQGRCQIANIYEWWAKDREMFFFWFLNFFSNVSWWSNLVRINMDFLCETFSTDALGSCQAILLEQSPMDPKNIRAMESMETSNYNVAAYEAHNDLAETGQAFHHCQSGSGSMLRTWVCELKSCAAMINSQYSHHICIVLNVSADVSGTQLAINDSGAMFLHSCEVMSSWGGVCGCERAAMDWNWRLTKFTQQWAFASQLEIWAQTDATDEDLNGNRTGFKPLLLAKEEILFEENQELHFLVLKTLVFLEGFGYGSMTLQPIGFRKY